MKDTNFFLSTQTAFSKKKKIIFNLFHRLLLQFQINSISGNSLHPFSQSDNVSSGVDIIYQTRADAIKLSFLYL